MVYAISWDRTVEVLSCEFFENWSYKQVFVTAIVSESDDKKMVHIDVLKEWFDYDSLKEVCTSEFVIRNWVYKVEWCDNVKQHIVGAMDDQGLFNQ